MVPFVPLGDLKAYATIIRYFSQKTRGGIYRHNRVQCSGSEENWEDQKGKNLVIIGGPFYNKAANTVLVATCSRLTQESKEQLPHLVGFWKGRSYKYDALEPTYSEKPPFQIALDLKRLKTYGDDTFSTSDFNRMHCPKIDLKTYTGCDYGLLIKCTNIYSYNKTVVILYGAHHYGTDGVARFVTDNRYLNELLQATKSRNNLWALVECIVSAGNITGVKLKDSGTLNFAGN